MNVLVVADGHYYMDSKGDVYVESVFDYEFYKRYLGVFDKVYAVARIQHVKEVVGNKKKASGENVEFLELPPYKGPWQYAKKYILLKHYAKKYSQICDCAVFRLPGATANFMCREYSKLAKKFAVEIVIDPWENFAPGTINSILRPVIRWSWTKIVKDMCLIADGVSYVTERYLQLKYPINNNGKQFSSFYSSVELKDDMFANPRKYVEKQSWHITHVANSFNDYSKGHISLINAVKLLVQKGYDITVTFIGDGPKKDEFKNYSQKVGLGEKVRFLGRLPNGEAVRNEIKNSDMFVFPTKAEGLPRVLLEAMAEGLPCISSPTCGVPEILEEDFLCDYDDSKGFSEKIERFICNPDLMTKESEKNILVSKKYAASILNKRRWNFYKSLKDSVDN